MATAFIADRGASTFPTPKPIGGGVSFVCWGSYNFSSAIVVNDTVAICKIPANTYVIDGLLRGPDIDTGTGVLELDVGFAANGVDTADPVAFIDSGALNGTLVANYLPVAGIRVPFAGILQSAGPKLFTVETTVMLKATAAANAGGTGIVTVVVYCVNP
jgi:hypothetical protein